MGLLISRDYLFCDSSDYLFRVASRYGKYGVGTGTNQLTSQNVDCYFDSSDSCHQ